MPLKTSFNKINLKIIFNLISLSIYEFRTYQKYFGPQITKITKKNIFHKIKFKKTQNRNFKYII